MYKSQQGGTGKSYSKSQHSFAVAQPTVQRERSTIDRPSRTITAIDAAFLYPCLIDEVLPGDTFQVNANVKAWLATPLKPFLDNLYINTFYFFVPNRLVWENWEKFQGEQDSPGDSVSFVVPQLEYAGGTAAGENKLADYMGLPTIGVNKEVNALPFRGYNLIYNYFFRDQNLQDAVTEDRGDANSLESNHVLLKRGKRKDYITGALPWPQKPGVGLTPGIISGVVPVTSTGASVRWEDQSANESTFKQDSVVNGLAMTPSAPDVLVDDEAIKFGSVTGLEADLDTAEANTINQLRQSIAIQQLLELDARSGTRYSEQLKARFGVTSPDHRLQRPEYLGGGQINIAVSPVPGTNQNGSGPGVGALGAFGGGQGSAGGFTHSFTEHGFVIGLVSLRSDLSYQEGIPRFWSRQTRYDYAEPALMHLGEQVVNNQEVFVSNDDDIDFGPVNGVWGYQERFSEYKYGNSMITSIMRSTSPTPLDQWHLGEQFLTKPTLNAAFIVDNPPVDRVIAVPSEPHVLMDLWFGNRCTRVMPVFNTPGLTRL